VIAGRICARPGCANPVVRHLGRAGRPPIYCSPECRPSHARTGARIGVELSFDDADDTTGAQRSWRVKLRRGKREVTVASGVGRFSATELANELRDLIEPARRKGDETE
jgi:hypothetical protein